MLKNIDFEKMSYEEGLALVAETRKNTLKQGRVKQAAPILDSLKQYWKAVPEEAKWSLYGAGAGGLGGLAASALTGKKKKKHYLRNMLTGSLLGGLAGYGGRLGYSALTDTPEKPDSLLAPETAQTINELHGATVGTIGRAGEAALYARFGNQMGNVLQNARARSEMINPTDPSGMYSSQALKDAMTEIEAMVDTDELARAKTLVNRGGVYDKSVKGVYAETDPKTGKPLNPLKPGSVGNKARGVAELRSWLDNATQADIKAAVRPGGIFHEHLPKGLGGGALDALASDMGTLRRTGGHIIGGAKKIFPQHRRSPTGTKGGPTGPALVDNQHLLSTDVVNRQARQQLVNTMLKNRQGSGLLGKIIGKGKLPTIMGLGLPAVNLGFDLANIQKARPILSSGKVPEFLQKYTPTQYLLP